MKIPTTWTEVSSKQLPEKIKAGTVVLAYTSTDISSGFANNLSVIQ
jgi:hypothetical protein